MSNAESNKTSQNEHWRRAVSGPLSSDFLRISTERELQEAADLQTAVHLQQQQQQYSHQPNIPPYMAQNILGRLSITAVAARLVKNYGISRMDPYLRIRVGHFVYETQTDPNGGRTPKWNRVINTQLPKGVQTISIEIYDECNFTMDELVAWAEIRIPDSVLRGETYEDWFLLSGKQGEGLEGSLQLVLSFSVPTTSYVYQPAPAPIVMIPNVSGRPMPVFVSPTQAPVQAPPTITPFTESEIDQIKEMFPDIEREVIKSVSEARRWNREETINSLLMLTK